MDKAALGKRLKDLRKLRKWTQRELERRSGVSERLIQEIEAGKANPSLSYLEDLGETLGAPIVEVAGADKLTEISTARHGAALKDVPGDFRKWKSLGTEIKGACLFLVTGDDRFLELLPLEFREVLKVVRRGLAPPNL